MNGGAMETTWQSEQSLSVTSPKELTAKPGSLEVQVKVIDSQNHVLGMSRTVTVPIAEKSK
ncbi:hypothetical protein LJK87_06475 [Paenibacillus sp. P25]|nr:hypothetical protein LJK87_06475 [Paenibacillus sp. P25]